MRVVFGILLAIMLFGCVSDSPESSAKTVEENTSAEPEESTGQETNESVEEDEPEDSVPGIIDVKDPEDIVEDKKDGPPAVSQDDCSTLSPNCETCIAQAGCGWCKSRNGCFFGDSSGPAGTVDCPSEDWAYSELECQGPKGGTLCEENWNCADCLSGSGCKWCIDGSRCASAGSTENCATGGWLTESFQCNYASR
jgi:hypothetical protein